MLKKVQYCAIMKSKGGVKMKYENEVKRISELLNSGKYAVFFGGAGVSTASGIPDFRGSKGLYTVSDEPCEYFLSRDCLISEPDRFYSFLKEKMIYPDAAPNDCHKVLAKLEEKGKIKAVITQNIDGLHQAAGSRRVIELHGTMSRAYCDRCGKLYPPESLEGETLPSCSCGGLIRPDVTLYGEALDPVAFASAEDEIKRAEVLIVCGTSLTVNPAASFVGRFRGEHLIIVNLSPTPYDHMAEYVIREPACDFFSQLVAFLEG